MDTILDAQTRQRYLPERYAGFWLRFSAFVIDFIILMFLSWIFSFILERIMFKIIGVDFLAQQKKETLLVAIMGSFAVWYLVCLLAFVLMESSRLQATPGKMAVGIKVGDASGNRITFSVSLGRWLAKLISAILFGYGFIMIGWDKKKQGLHDKLAAAFVFEP